jgi:hypothetical protein
MAFRVVVLFSTYFGCVPNNVLPTVMVELHGPLHICGALLCHRYRFIVVLFEK